MAKLNQAGERLCAYCEKPLDPARVKRHPTVKHCDRRCRDAAYEDRKAKGLVWAQS